VITIINSEKLYSGHDNTLGPLLISLNVFDHLHPPVASTLVLELYEDVSKKHYVRVVYNDKLLNIPGGGENGLCEFNTFQKLAQTVIPTDYEKECSIPL
jgi:hypothetical protein